VSHLIDLYGSRYRNVLALTKANPQLKEPLRPGAKDIGAQVVYAVREELAETVSDVMLRRICNALDTDAGLNAVESVGQIMARELGWTPEKTRAEIDAYTRFIAETNLGFRGNRSAN
jgi:glycerol-3-phosphate dehydrogenase